MSSGAYDYEALGLVAGLEIHQQLDTEEKLFCACPTTLREPEASTGSFFRYLHPTPSELGEIDPAAEAESRVGRRFEYRTYDSTCLVEEDEEPPRRLDEEALAVAMQIALSMEMDILDQVHIMRKIVVDGSNTTGFQRSALLGVDGEIHTSAGPVRVADLLLEEESARRIGETDDGVRYSLDRLGIPLVEIGTEPDITSPAQAQEAAERIGMILRSTGAVKRGLGTIRQDVNVSIEEGARIELKGVQDLDAIDALVEAEVRRQLALIDISEELRARDATVDSPTDVSDVFEATDSGILQGVLAEDGVIMAVTLRGFDGLVGREIQPDRRLGSELADHARRQGAGGIFHTDELPAHGITAEEVGSLRSRLHADDDDAVALVAADRETAERAIAAVVDRAAAAIEGVPEETRRAEEDGTSRYLRPLPGAARMYPETDVPPVEPDPGTIEVPERLTEKVERYTSEFDLDPGLAEQVAYGQHMSTFEAAIDAGVDPTLAATTLENTLTELRRDGVAVEGIGDGQLLALLRRVDAGELTQESVPDVLGYFADDPEANVDEAIEALELSLVDREDVRETVAEIVERNREQVDAEGMGAFSGLMGECMAALRGRADGELVSDILREEIQRRTSG